MHDAVAPPDPLDPALHPAAARLEALPHLDTPLVTTLDLDPLRRRPGWHRIRLLRRAAESGRHGERWRQVVDRRATPPRMVGLWAGSLGALIYVFAIAASVVEGDLEGAGTGLTLAVLTGLLLGSIAGAIAAAARRRRWRPHAVVARFAEANALPYRLMSDGDALPALVRRPADGRGQRPLHLDVVEARVRGRELTMGRRLVRTQAGHRRSSVVLVWIATRVADADTARTAAESFRLLDRRRAQEPRHVVEVMVDGEWLALGVESRDGDPAALAVLIEGIDEALEAADAAGPTDVARPRGTSSR